MKKLSCRVLVVGGGPAGATACRELNRLGINNILLEKNLNFTKPCGGGLMMSAFSEFNIPKSLIHKKINKIEIISPTLKRAMVDIKDYPLTIVNRYEFDRKLRKLAREGGTTIIEAKAYNIDLKNSPIVFAKSKNMEFEIHAQYIIAADGVNSTLRKKALNETHSRIITRYMDIENINIDSCQFWFGSDISPKHYSWIFPHHNRINIGLACDNEKQIGAYFHNFLKKSGLESSNRAKGYYIPQWSGERVVYFKKNIFFVGDSASMVLPFTYEGIYYAMKSASIAVNAISKNEPSLYQKEWEKLYLKKFKFLRLLQRLFLSNDYFSERLVQLYQKKSFQKSVITYWMGEKEPTDRLLTIWKFIKVIFKY